jgi:hypothetical protein
MIPETEKMSDMNDFDSGVSEHRIIFRQWRLGFLIFYGAIASLLGGFALVADRPGSEGNVVGRFPWLRGGAQRPCQF